MPDHRLADDSRDEQRSNDQSTPTTPSTSADSHLSVFAVPGSPPLFACNVCGAYRSTQAGLKDLPCQPGRYDDVTPAERANVGDVVHARIDQVLKTTNSGFEIFAHTVGTGVPVGLETEARTLARGDEIGVHITDTDRSASAQLEQVISREDRVRPLKLVPIEEGVRADE